MDVIGLHFSGADFFGQILSNGLAETKLAILAFLYCGEFVKNSTRVSSERVPEWHFIITMMSILSSSHQYSILERSRLCLKVIRVFP